MASITVGFSNTPSDVALLLSQSEHIEQLAEELARSMDLPQPECRFIHDELIGAVAEIVDGHLAYVTQPRG